MERVSSSTMKLMKNANRVYQQVIVKAGWIMTKETTTMIPVLVNRPHPIGRQSSLNAAAQISHPFQWFSTSNSSISISSFIFVFLSSATEWPALFSAGNSLISKELLQNTEFRHRVMRKWIQIPPFVSNIAHRRKHGQGCLTLNANHLMIKIKNRSGTGLRFQASSSRIVDPAVGHRGSRVAIQRAWRRHSITRGGRGDDNLLSKKTGDAIVFFFFFTSVGFMECVTGVRPVKRTRMIVSYFLRCMKTGNEEEYIHRSFINRFL